jgi:hypothetical protein
MGLTDGRYSFEDGPKKAVFDLYTVNGILYYDYTLNGTLLVKEGQATLGEDRERLINRLQHIVRNSNP